MVGANRQYVSDAKHIAQDASEILDHGKQGKLRIPQAKQVARIAASDAADATHWLPGASARQAA